MNSVACILTTITNDPISNYKELEDVLEVKIKTLKNGVHRSHHKIMNNVIEIINSVNHDDIDEYQDLENNCLEHERNLHIIQRSDTILIGKMKKVLGDGRTENFSNKPETMSNNKKLEA